MVAEYGFKIKRDGINKDVEDCDPKETAFNSKYPCAKILQTGKYAATSGAVVQITLAATVSFPIHVLCFLYDIDLEEYEPVIVEFDSTKLYLPAEGRSSGSYFYYFVCYA